MNRLVTSFLVVGMLLTACQTDPGIDSPSEAAIQTVGFKLTQYGGDEIQTKTEYRTDGNGKFVWATGDIVGIISEEGNQMMFPIKSEYYGQDYALFDGRGFALVAGNTYVSYYPFQADYGINAAALPVSYKGQAQAGDNSMAHLGQFSFTKATGESPAAGVLDFEYENVGSPHRYRLPVVSGTYTKFTIGVSASKYIVEGTLDLTSASLAISPSKTDKTMSLDLTNTTMGNGDKLRLWMMLPPADLTGETIHLSLLRSDGSEIVAVVAGRDCPANQRRVFNALTSAYPADSEVSAEGGAVNVQLIRSAEGDAVVVSSDAAWLTETSSVTSGLVTTYTFSASENSGAERLAHISFAETSTGLTNQIQVKQAKAGTIIGIGGWNTDNHNGNAE